MPKLEPFTGIRYSEGTDLSLVASPPYDMIASAQRRRLLDAHPHSFVQLILPEGGPAGYEAAAATLRRWLDEGVLAAEDSESYYLYRADYLVGEAVQSTAGLIGALALEPFGKDGEGGILPHEQTMPGPKADRLQLMRATRANLEPLWFVASRPIPELPALVDAASSRDPQADAIDGESVRHRLWRIDRSDADSVAGSLAATSVVIADGHHRYETALTYRDERNRSDGPGRWDFTLGLVVDPQTYGPALLPIHRAARGVSVEDLEAAGPLDMYKGRLEELESHIAEHGPGLVGVVLGERLWTMTVQGGLDTAFVANRILEPAGAEVTYHHELAGLSEETEDAAAGFVMSPVGIETVIDYSLRGERMPPKTTLFWPKPRSGFVFRLLD